MQYSVAIVIIMTTAVQGSQFLSEESQLGGKFKYPSDKKEMSNAQKKDWLDYQKKLPQLFDNKDARVTWMQFWKAYEEEVKSKYTDELEF